MRGLTTIGGLIALTMLVTPLVAQGTGDLASAVILELMGFVTAASVLTRHRVQGG